MSRLLHAISTEEAIEELRTSKKGLSSEEAAKRFREYGPNELQTKKKVTAVEILLHQFKDIFVIMLIVATVIAFYVDTSSGELPIDAIIIAVIVILNSIIGFIQEYKSEKAMEAMKSLTAPKARLLRDGKETTVAAREVVPGDILLLEAGDRVAADGRLIETIDLRTDEAVLTGESNPIDKDLSILNENASVGDRKNSVFTATFVTYGRGRAIVTSTGMKTEFGKIAETVQSVEEEEPPLQVKLDKFAKKIAILVVAVCVFVFVLEVLNPARPGEIVENFLTAIALAVSAVPEGLPAVVTVTLALGARELSSRNAIIRRLASVETLGSTDIICSDKTGTLTKGEMTVRKIWVNGNFIDVTGAGYDSKGDFRIGDQTVDFKEEGLSLLLTASALCTNATYDGKNVTGDTTEGALIVAAAKAGLTKEDLEEKFPRVHEITFTSERKIMTTVHKNSDGKLMVYVKGAPEIVAGRCTGLLIHKRKRKLGENERNDILQANEEMANQALRVLGIGYKELTEIQEEDLSKKGVDETVENGLVFIGLVGMMDPPREEVKEAVRKCHGAGIKTVMITGDHKLTAVAVAKELGMIQGGEALTGDELGRMDDAQFESVVENVSVYARVLPEHKLRIVKALKKRGHVVAMTGDGVNDAPALKQSDIGVAMGITGTDVTKEAADMVLADDNFATIVNAVEGGRTIYDNIRKFAFFLIRSNFDELFIIGTFALLGLELPLTAGMILWINLMTDGAPAIALSQDPPSEDVMKRPPRNPAEGLIYGRIASILGTLVTQFLGTAILFYIAYYVLHEPLEEARSLAFMQATLQELIVVWNCRSETKNAFKVGFTSNRFLLYAVLFSGAITFIIPYTGILFGIPLLGTAPMSVMDWLIVIPFSLSGFLIVPEVFYNRKVFRWR